MKVQDVREQQALKDLPASLHLIIWNSLRNSDLSAVTNSSRITTPAGLQNETPEFEKDPCAFCFWKYQATKLGCVTCVDKSEYVDYCSVEASEKKKQLVQLLRTKHK